MSRIPALDPADASPKAKPMLDAVNKLLGVTPNMFKVAAQSPATLEGLLGLNGALARGTFNARTREAISLAVAEANGCDYCLSAHTALGQRAGLSVADIAAARAGRADDAKTAALVRFARALTLNRGQASDADLAALRQEGLDDGQIIEAVGNTVVNIFTNTLNLVAGTEIDFPVVRTGLAHAA